MTNNLHFSALIVALFWITPQTLMAQEVYCALEVTVVSAAGTPVSRTSVLMVDQKGNIFSTSTTDEKGIVRFCDVPSGLIDLQVGGNRCGAVVVRYLRPYWMRTKHVSIVYEDCGGEDHMPPGGCLLTVRVQNENHLPLPGVRFEDQSEHRSSPTQQIADEFGRIFRSLAWGETLAGSLAKDGYASKTIDEPCKRGEPYRRERVILLPKSRIQSNPRY